MSSTDINDNNEENVVATTSLEGQTNLQVNPIIVGCIGGGQLGQMMAMISNRLNIRMLFLDPGGTNCPASYCVPTTSIIHGSLQDSNKIQELASATISTATTAAAASTNDVVRSVITMETEHVNVNALIELEKNKNINVVPSSRVMKIIQDKLYQKQYLQQNNIPIPSFQQCNTIQDIYNAGTTTSTTTNNHSTSTNQPIMLKSRFGGYDGKGNAVVPSNSTIYDIISIVQQLLPKLQNESNDTILSLTNLNLYAEGWINFTMEVAVMVVKSINSTNSTTTTTDNNIYSTRAYPVVNAIQDKSICRVVIAPTQNLSNSVQEHIQQLAIRTIDTLGIGAAGVFGVEMFIINHTIINANAANNNNLYTCTGRTGTGVIVDGYEILINEIAPRPHNTGHYTQDACTISQFENHLRAICGLPLGSTNMIVPISAMINILGPNTSSSTGATTGTSVTTGTGTSTSVVDALTSCNQSLQNDTTYNSIVHWYCKNDIRPGRKVGHINLTATTYKELLIPLRRLMEIEQIPLSLLPHQQQDDICDVGVSSIPASQKDSGACTDTRTPIVGVIMGSHSDLPTMNDAVTILKQFNIPYEVDIVSAHRTPDKLMNYSRTAVQRGIQIIIAGAGGAAHLPGMVASMTSLPVIGVPIKTSTLNGIDSLYSIVQMPKGIPVATVAIGNATNAGLLAIRILSISSKSIQEQMIQYQTNLSNAVHDTSTKLIQLGSDEYLQQMDNKNTSVNV